MTEIKPEGGSRLDQLAAAYALAKPLADEAAEKLKAITDAIKVELTTAAPGEQSVDLVSEHLPKPLRAQYKETWRFDSKRLKADDPHLYVRYAKKSGSWELRAVSS
ncbi:hypothetical protein BAY59_10915 [Prauserella coralliicola]|nr:hypothetical protein BAY59_10915 [Prauserella coralliicola]